MNFVFRPYRRRDKKALCRIIAPTWRFDEYFPGIKNTERLCAFVIDMFRLQSDYTDVAVPAAAGGKTKASASALVDGVPAGFLFADASAKRSGVLKWLFYRIQKSAVFTAFYVKIFFLWLAGFYGARAVVRKAFLSYCSVQKNILKDISFDAEIVCLFVDTSYQGSGLGRRLLSRLFEWSKKRKIRSFVLTTDTDCNFRFYDRGGFKRLKEQSGCLGIPQNTEPSSRIFVYGFSLSAGSGFSSAPTAEA